MNTDLQCLTTSLASERLRKTFRLPISERTLRAMASRGEGPPRYVIGGRKFYNLKTLDRWALTQFKIDVSYRASEMVGA